jgi:hypothetical protein
MRNTLLAALIIGLFIAWPASSYADWNGHSGDGHSHDGGGHGHDGGGHGHSYIGVNFSVWPDSYYYNGPYYYPPVDAVLVSPPDYEPVVQQPVTVIQPPPVVDNEAQSAGPVITTVGAPTSDTSDSFTINIPNNKGGYTAVTLKRSGNGYIGPQGEFYPEFPKVSQLEVIYGK